MPIKPIDLQTLFTQLDRVGREKAAERDSNAMQISLAAQQAQKKALESNSSVQATADQVEISEKSINVDDKEEKQAQESPEEGAAEKKKEEGSGAETPPEPEVIKDPKLGNKIDISG
jgi:hypothetical protein